MTAIEAHVQVSPSAAVRQDAIARNAAASRGHDVALGETPAVDADDVRDLETEGALGAVSVVHEGTSLGYREPVLFLFGRRHRLLQRRQPLERALGSATSAVLTRGVTHRR
jgi:hypothetical protein